jgi:Kdo2-lipid IVA lauroyltransferase/acyltransferase
LSEPLVGHRHVAGDQAPVVLSWQRQLLGRLHFTGVFWYRLHALALRVLPRFLLAPGVLVFAMFFSIVLRGVRRAIGHNLEWVEGERVSWLRRQAWAFRTIWNHAWCMTETYDGLVGSSKEPDVLVEGVEHWDRVTSGVRGFVLVTAHVGHWEVGSRLARPGPRRRIHVVRAPEIDPKAQEFLRSLLEQSGGDSFEVHFTRPDDPALGARLLGALRKGDVVALQGDRARAGQRAARVSLLGRPHEVPLGPAALARAAEVPLLPVFVFRRGRARSTVVFHPSIDVPRTSDRDADGRVAAAAIAAAVESAIRRQPHQWFCFRDLWGRPPRRAR